MKCLSKDCKTTSLLMTVEVCYPCSQLIEHKLLGELLARIKELEAKLKEKNND